MKDKLEEILNNKPFYITPSMMPDDINGLIQEIYSEIIKNDLRNIEGFDIENATEEDRDLLELANEYSKIRESYPKFLKKLKSNTDGILEQISSDVSDNIKNLF